ncbi:MAG: EamA family transporter [Bacteroidaceae bacterium]|nr:EamA family transporter [Bacteroidaceae bacterium]
MKGKSTWLTYLLLIFSNLVYACTCIFTKTASSYSLLSAPYILCIAGAIFIMGIYAILWQQVIKRMPVSDAYMFRGTAVIFTMIIACLLFSEPVSASNIAGASLIIAGIALFAKS